MDQAKREKQKIYEKKNRLKRIEYQKKHYKKNEEHYKAYKKGYYLELCKKNRKKRSDDVDWKKDFKCFEGTPKQVLLRILREV